MTVYFTWNEGKTYNTITAEGGSHQILFITTLCLNVRSNDQNTSFVFNLSLIFSDKT